MNKAMSMVLERERTMLDPQLQNMTFFNEISSVHEQ